MAGCGDQLAAGEPGAAIGTGGTGFAAIGGAGGLLLLYILDTAELTGNGGVVQGRNRAALRLDVQLRNKHVIGIGVYLVVAEAFRGGIGTEISGGQVLVGVLDISLAVADGNNPGGVSGVPSELAVAIAENAQCLSAISQLPCTGLTLQGKHDCIGRRCGDAVIAGEFLLSIAQVGFAGNKVGCNALVFAAVVAQDQLCAVLQLGNGGNRLIEVFTCEVGFHFVAIQCPQGGGCGELVGLAGFIHSFGQSVGVVDKIGYPAHEGEALGSFCGGHLQAGSAALTGRNGCHTAGNLVGDHVGLIGAAAHGAGVGDHAVLFGLFVVVLQLVNGLMAADVGVAVIAVGTCGVAVSLTGGILAGNFLGGQMLAGFGAGAVDGGCGGTRGLLIKEGTGAGTCCVAGEAVVCVSAKGFVFVGCSNVGNDELAFALGFHGPSGQII